MSWEIGADAMPWVYAIGMLVVGFLLILLEIFLIPGINIFGILGFGTVCAGVAFAYVRLGTGAAVGVGLLAITGTAALVWLLVRNRAWQRLVLDSETDRASGFDTAPVGLVELVSESGVAQTPLRPSGRARFGGQLVDVVTEGAFIDTGARIEVLSVNGNRVVVQEQAEPAGVDPGVE